MNIFEYIKKYGEYTFEEKEFNDVDNVIFSMLTYANYEEIVSTNNKNKKSINEVSIEFFNKYTEEELKNNITATKTAIDLLDKVSNINRYKDITMFNYTYIKDDNSQFSAITFEIGKNEYYVAFEGTDQLISGWQEDCEMAYKFPVEAHLLSKRYLDKFFTFKNCKLIVGGHSKGGNLALVAAMYSNYFVKKKIRKIYSNDGQGLRLAQLNSPFYSKIEDRFIHIIPNYSIVGLLLRNKNDYKIVKSSKKGLLAHNAIYWIVDDNHFKETNLSRSSEVFNEGFSKWLDKYDDEKRKKFVNEIFKIFEENDIKSLLEIKLKKDLLIGFINSSKTISEETKEMALDLIKVLTKTNLEYPLF